MDDKDIEFDIDGLAEYVKQHGDIFIFAGERSPEFYTRGQDGKYFTIVQSSESGRITAHDSLEYLGKMTSGSTNEKYIKTFQAFVPVVLSDLASRSLGLIHNQNKAILSMLQQLAYKLQADEKSRIQTKLNGLFSECEHFLTNYVTYFENDKSREAAYQRVQSLRFNVKEFCSEVLQRLNKEIDVFVQKDGERIFHPNWSVHFEIEDGYSEQLEFYFKTYFHCVCIFVVAAILEWYFFGSDHPDYYKMLKKEVSSELEKYNNVASAIKRKVDEEKNSIDRSVNLIRELKFWDNDSWLRWQHVNDNGEIRSLIRAFQERVKEDNDHFQNMYKNVSKLMELDIKKLPFFCSAPDIFPEVLCRLTDDFLKSNLIQESKPRKSNAVDLGQE